MNFKLFSLAASVALTLVAPTAFADASLKCVFTADKTEQVFTGSMWAGHGLHLSLGPYDSEINVTYQGVDYGLSATFDALDLEFQHPLGSRVTIRANGFLATSATEIGIMVPPRTQPVRLNCEVL